MVTNIHPIPIPRVAFLGIAFVSAISAAPLDVCDASSSEAPENANRASLMQLVKSRTLPARKTNEEQLKASTDAVRRSCIPPPAAETLKVLLERSPKRSNASKAASSDQDPSFLHELVGSGGVLQISLERNPERRDFASQQLELVGIKTTLFPATDGSCTPQDVLQEACSSDCSPDEAAISHSHKRALEVASLRDEQWTAIFEDDAVPVLMDGMTRGDWDAELRRIWPLVPDATQVVRLSWCLPDSDKWSLQWESPTIGEMGEGKMRLTQFGMMNEEENTFHSVGLCTTAYMVRKDAIDRLLTIFPCNGALDACMGWKFFNTWDSSGAPGLTYLYNLDMEGSTSFIRSIQDTHGMKFFGVMMQARGQVESTVSSRSR